MLLSFVFFTGKAQHKECLSLFTDHDLYVSGETLLLKVFAPASEKSGIVNIDLVSSVGKKILGINIEIIEYQADGFIYLPDSLSSGCYLLRSSTRTNNTLTIKELFIVNRFVGLPESNTLTRPVVVLPMYESLVSEIKITGIQSQYKTGEIGHSTIQIPSEFLNQIDGNILVEVVKVTPEYKSTTFLIKSDSLRSPIPVKEGIILEGLVTDVKTTQPFQNAVVYLSIPDSIPEFQYFITGKDGRFYFQIEKYYGKMPLVIQCFAREKFRFLKIEIIDSKNVSSLTPSFTASTFMPALRKTVDQKIDAVTFRKIFHQQEISIQPNCIVKREKYPFYGMPTKVIDPQLFIDLPNFNEISRELLPGVKYRNYNRIPTLQVFNVAQQVFFNEQPLLLLDGIPIRDLNVIKDMGSKDIDKVEICQSERFFGDLIFPGVIAIYTSKADYSRVAESNDLIKVNLDVIQPRATLNNSPEKKLTEPDLREVLVWNPSTKPDTTIILDFQTSDIHGNFKLIIHCKTIDGTNFFKEQIFEVK